ncbi:transposon tf2-9 polyprotein [Plakobranchus ocellatus]|uniref:Transposon tf2-9 polyprotein n=1 Tax=Plakobranchus ocellatus TaxID=259542 RepID=A0AAV4BZF3_9GAST|nr:transposon tf2-9 polyprotein [Plakobranchus ocellatus]
MALQRLSDKDFRFQLAKCVFAVPKVIFLGHVISANGIQPDPKKCSTHLGCSNSKNCEANTEFFGERSYVVNEKEALACVWTCKTWEKYLLGRHFTLRTDHSSLASLPRSTTDSRKSAKFTRWLDRLSPFDYTVDTGKVRITLWLILSAVSPCDLRNPHCVIQPNPIGALQTDHLSLLVVKSATKRDSTLSTVLHLVSSGWPSKKTLQTEDQSLLWENRIVFPTALRRRLLTKAHEGHIGIVRMKRKLRQSYWWPRQGHRELHKALCGLSTK